MAEGSGDNPFVKTVGPVIGGLIGGLLTWLTTGLPGWLSSALAALLAITGAVCGVIFSLMYQRYLGVLAAGREPEGSEERKAYDRLRDSLATENLAARLFARWLKKLLDKVDSFFGDADMADRTLFPHAFGLQTLAPLWTAPAFDRCLLLALIYPIAMIFLIWAVSGHVGPAEAAIGLQKVVGAWRRLLALGALASAAVALSIWLWKENWTAFVCYPIGLTLIYLSTVAGAFDIAVAGAVALAFGVAFASARASALRGAFAITFASTFAVAFAKVGASSNLQFIIAGAIAFAIAAAVTLLQTTARGFRAQGPFQVIFLLMLQLFCLVAAKLLSPLSTWDLCGPLLLFLGLLTLLNAPFDWGSLGLTRALLRRGLERGGWWPFLYGLVDAALAAVIIAALALTMVLGVQAFDDLAAHGGGEVKRILPLVPFFDGIAKNPSAPEYWWVYALLFSTMIPSLLNLMIGGASLARGVPFVPQLLLPFMPIGRAVPAFDRAWIALVLTLQSVGGAVLGLLMQFLLAYGMLAYLMPWLGLNLLDLARGLAALDLPTRIGQFFGGMF
jgi:hypothetical protein